MKEKFILLIMVLSIVFIVFAANVTGFGSSNVVKDWKKNDCTTIQDGILLTSDGEVIITGYDSFGYNYQSHMFNGRYCDYDRVIGGAYCDVSLVMKWNDVWLANTDCNGDGLLDRHFETPTYIGSGAWITNHQSGEYELDGKICKWKYFTKIVAAPKDAVSTAGVWYTANEIEIGPVIWGAFATIQTIYSDPCGVHRGVEYLSPNSPGFGVY